MSNIQNDQHGTTDRLVLRQEFTFGTIWFKGDLSKQKCTSGRLLRELGSEAQGVWENVERHRLAQNEGEVVYSSLQMSVWELKYEKAKLFLAIVWQGATATSCDLGGSVSASRITFSLVRDAALMHVIQRAVRSSLLQAVLAWSSVGICLAWSRRDEMTTEVPCNQT